MFYVTSYSGALSTSTALMSCIVTSSHPTSCSTPTATWPYATSVWLVVLTKKAAKLSQSEQNANARYGFENILDFLELGTGWLMTGKNQLRFRLFSSYSWQNLPEVCEESESRALRNNHLVTYPLPISEREMKGTSRRGGTGPQSSCATPAIMTQRWICGASDVSLRNCSEGNLSSRGRTPCTNCRCVVVETV